MLGEFAQPKHKKRHLPAGRASLACRWCRQHKVRCSGEKPCRNCETRKLTCIYVGQHTNDLTLPTINNDLPRSTTNNSAVIKTYPSDKYLNDCASLFFDIYGSTLVPFLRRQVLMEDIRLGRCPDSLLFSILALTSR